MWEGTPEQEAALKRIPEHLQLQMAIFERDLELESHAALVAIAKAAFRDLMFERINCKSQERLTSRLERQLKDLERMIIRSRAVRRRIAIYVHRTIEVPAAAKATLPVPEPIRTWQDYCNGIDQCLQVQQALLSYCAALPAEVGLFVRAQCEQKICLLQNSIHATLTRADVWCHENSYRLITERINGRYRLSVAKEGKS